MIIPSNEIKILNKIGLDDTGFVFTWKNKIFRAINKDSVERIKDLLESGLIKELEINKLFPKTKVSNYELNDFELIIEHELIENETYPHEWSFEMFKDAAICTLKVNQISKVFGFQTIDAHKKNIIFKNSRPYFIDLGSFIKAEGESTWFASEEFYRSFLYPLKLWQNKYLNISNSLIRSDSEPISHTEYFRIINPFSRLIPYNFFNRFLRGYFILSRLTSVSDKIIEKRISPFHFRVYKVLKKNNLLPFQKFIFDKKIEEINKIAFSDVTYWTDYQSATGEFKPTSRFKKIAKLLRDLKVKSVVDLAGNQGFFTEYLLDQGIVEQAYCLDYDPGAIDNLYKRVKGLNKSIIPVVQNIIFPKNNFGEKLPEERFISDVAVALAVTHHLLLTQYVPLRVIFSRASNFSKKFVMIEFMPLGLWNGKYSLPTPDWYTQEFFEEEFKKFFEVVEIIKLEKNRVLFVGKKK